MKSLFAHVSKLGLILMALTSAAIAAESVDTTLEPGTTGTITGSSSTTSTTSTVSTTDTGN